MRERPKSTLLAGIAMLIAVPACQVADGGEMIGEQSYPSAASGVTPTLLSRGTYARYAVESEGDVKYEAKTGAATDIVVREHKYAPRGYTGWHKHPGPVFITVLEGTVTFYEADDPTCTPRIVHAGQGYVDDGEGHYGVNATDDPARDMTVIMAPVGGGFREEIDPPGNCPF